jgi:hypothetical protein
VGGETDAINQILSLLIEHQPGLGSCAAGTSRVEAHPAEGAPHHTLNMG